MSQSAAARSDQEPGEASEVNRRVERALISVSDKTGVVDFARGLAAHGVRILSTGGTASALREAGLDVVDVSEHTGSPEILDGRVKTLHPKIHGGILARRDDASHQRQVDENGISYIDLVCVNLYPFAKVTARGCTFEEAIENIDIGGPSMVRSAAKNHADVAIVVDPTDYAMVLEEIGRTGGVSGATRRELSVKAYRATAAYDGMIADWLGRQGVADDETGELQFGETVHQQWEKVQDLRYGENPHQSAAFYRARDAAGPSLATARVLQGKALSYNNIVDGDAALQLIMEFRAPEDEAVCVAIKHTNPCGAARASSAVEAFTKARSCDPVSIFGGIVAFNREVDEATAEQMKDVFLEIVLAPSFTPGALAVYDSTPKLRNVRLLEVDLDAAGGEDAFDMKRVLGGLLVQTRDLEGSAAHSARVATRRSPTEPELPSTSHGGFRNTSSRTRSFSRARTVSWASVPDR